MRTIVSLLIASLALTGLARAGLSIDGGLSHEFVLEPGTRHEGTLVVSNSGGQPQGGRAYQTDYRFFADGTNEYLEPGSISRSNAPWIAFSPREFVVPANGTITIDYIIQVPANPELDGSFWSMLMIEPVESPSPIVQDQPPNSLGVRMIVRHGIQFVVTIGEGGTKDIRIEGSLASDDPGNPRLQLQIINTGQVWLRPGCWTEIYNQEGAIIGRLESDPLRIYPECSVKHSFPLEFPPGDYYALVVIDNGDGEAWGAQYDFELR